MLQGVYVGYMREYVGYMRKSVGCMRKARSLYA